MESDIYKNLCEIRKIEKDKFKDRDRNTWICSILGVIQLHYFVMRLYTSIIRKILFVTKISLQIK